MSLLILCPSYRRPIAATAVLESFRKTKTLPDTSLMFLLWDRDRDSHHYDGPDFEVVLCPEKDMVPRCNGALGLLDGIDYVGWIADDNRFRTKGWDEIVAKSLAKKPIAFGNDIVSPGSKPSHVFMDARIPLALGWLILPGLHSTFADDVWQTLGTGRDSTTGPFNPHEKQEGLGISYLPTVLVEHLYIEKDNSENFAKDFAIYRKWLRNEAEDDIAKAQRALRSRRDPSGSARPSLRVAQPGADPVGA